MGKYYLTEFDPAIGSKGIVLHPPLAERDYFVTPDEAFVYADERKKAAGSAQSQFVVSTEAPDFNAIVRATLHYTPIGASEDYLDALQDAQREMNKFSPSAANDA